MPYHAMRRHDRAITDSDEIERLLGSGRFATVALCDGDTPYAVTLSYGYDAPGRRLCFHVAPEGRKLDIIERNPRACASIVADNGYTPGKCEHPFESAIVFGTMRVLEDPDEVRAAMRVLVGHLEAAEDVPAIWERTRLDTEARLATFRGLVLEIDDVSAKAGR